MSTLGVMISCSSGKSEVTTGTLQAAASSKQEGLPSVPSMLM